MHSEFPSFSHLYIEREVRDLPLAREIIAKFPKATIIEIENYREIFNQPRQHWREQKKSPKIILAAKHGVRVHPSTEVLPVHHGPPLHYASPLLNCIYDCQYCFLQAMYRSANMVVFVNAEDFYRDVRCTIKERGAITLSVSYDSDLLASESFIPWATRWIEFARDTSDLTVEIRTKSANYSLIRRITPTPNVILAWSMAPETSWKHFEPLTASPQRRLKNIAEAIEAGWRTRICLDPVIPISNWQVEYLALIKEIFSHISPIGLEDISIGVFRMGEDHIKNLRTRAPSLALLQTALTKDPKNKIVSLDQADGLKISAIVAQILSNYLSTDKIVIW